MFNYAALHRIPSSRLEYENSKSKSKSEIKSNTVKPVVLLMHGFLMCSEVWVSTPDPVESLAFTLADAGYVIYYYYFILGCMVGKQ